MNQTGELAKILGMGKKAAVFSHNGLGDGINCLVLSNQLHLNGYEVDTYQNVIGSMQNWFPHLPVQRYPGVEDLSRILSIYDWFFVVWNDSSEFVKKLIEEGKRRFPERMKVIYLYPSPNIVNEPYYADCLTDWQAPVAENMRIICREVMHLPKMNQSNGFIAPEGLQFRKFPKRIVFHPTSGSPNRNWPKEHFVKLALHLKSEGYAPVFVPGKADLENFQDVLELGIGLEDFASLDLLARFIYESGYLIGNDSGLGHLASALGIETLTFCRRKALADLWAPSFSRGIVLTPSRFIPNIRGLRIRDRFWRNFISVNRARRSFELLANS